MPFIDVSNSLDSLDSLVFLDSRDSLDSLDLLNYLKTLDEPVRRERAWEEGPWQQPWVFQTLVRFPPSSELGNLTSSKSTIRDS